MKPAITGFAELRRKVIGTKLGGFGELFVEHMLEAGRLTRAEVTLINTDSNLVPDQLRAGVIDAGQTWEPYVSRVVQAGAGSCTRAAEDNSRSRTEIARV